MENTEEIYTDFARVYDELMDNTPYEVWCNRLDQLIASYGVSRPTRDAEGILDSERNLVVDLGCGTGTLTELLYQKGYDCIGVDNSEEMLGIAMEKKVESGSEILYLHQDMRELDLYSTVGTVISVCDSVNYILEEEEVLKQNPFRKIKVKFKENENPCTCPPNFPVCVCGKVSKGKVITRKPIIPSEEEIEVNKRAKSSKLRIFERR